MKKIFFLLTFCLLLPEVLFAQNVGSIDACPYKFSKDLKLGDTDEDVFVIQQILNSDKRTVVTLSGTGSPGQESGYFGKATREALKKFQALFIEYIGVADGKFSIKTRAVMQHICSDNGESTQTTSTTQKDDTKMEVLRKDLKVVLSANTTIIPSGSQLKVLIDFSNDIPELSQDALIIDGGSVKEIRKMSKKQFLAVIVSNEDAKNIDVQIEADKVKDVDGNTNQNASNEILVSVSSGGIGSAIVNTVGSIADSLGSILNKITSGLPATQYCNGVQISASVTCNPSAVSSAVASQQAAAQAVPQPAQPQPQQQNPLAQMLMGVLGGASKSASGQSGQNGAGSGRESPEVEEGPSGINKEPMGNVQIPANTPESCKKNYGLIVSGSCSTKDLTGKVTQSVADAGMAACAANGGKPVTVTSVHRTPECNKAVGGSPPSNHLHGAAIDVPPRDTLITKAFEAKGLKKYDEKNHWHYSVSGR